MHMVQSGILAPLPRTGRYLVFALAEPAAARMALLRVAPLVDGERCVLALGLDLVAACGAAVPGLHPFPRLLLGAAPLPATEHALCCWLRGDDTGELLALSRKLEAAAAPALRLTKVLDAFRHGGGPGVHGRDITGYEDGTENPVDDLALAAAAVAGAADGMTGSSFMAWQPWRHDFAAFDAMSGMEQDNAIGRRRSDNAELEDAPLSAHVKRTAQEDFEPPAFLLRRSMSWARGRQAGLVFVAFGHSLDAFEAQLRRMLGLDDGITDALFRFSMPTDGACFWCPPMRDGAPDLRQLAL